MFQKYDLNYDVSQLILQIAEHVRIKYDIRDKNNIVFVTCISESSHNIHNDSHGSKKNNIVFVKYMMSHLKGTQCIGS